jgi:hypothetical protein
MSAEFGTLYLQLLNGNEGVLPPNDLEAQLPAQDDPAEVEVEAKDPMKANPLQTASISLSAVQMGTRRPNLEGQEHSFLVHEFDGHRRQRCHFVWRNGEDGTHHTFGNEHAFELIKRIGQTMCSPTEVMDKIVVAYTNDGYVSMIPGDAMELWLRHRPHSVVVYKTVSLLALVNQIDRAEGITNLAKDKVYDGIDSWFVV